MSGIKCAYQKCSKTIDLKNDIDRLWTDDDPCGGTRMLYYCTKKCRYLNRRASEPVTHVEEEEILLLPNKQPTFPFFRSDDIYPTLMKLGSPDSVISNAMFVSHCVPLVEHLKEKSLPYTFIVLDAATHVTSKCLRAIGVPRLNIHVPNTFASISQDGGWKGKDGFDAVFFNCSYLEYIEERQQDRCYPPVAGLFLDYCSTATTIQNDLYKSAKILYHPNAIIAVKCSTRGCGVKETKKIVNDILTKEFGWKVKLIEKRKQPTVPVMLMLVYKLY